MKTARDWKSWYAQERERLGPDGLRACLADADALGLAARLGPAAGAAIFPHTRLEFSGALPAAVALAAVRSGVDTVLALGVLHSGREQDADAVARVRAGDAELRGRLRRIHGPGAAGDDGLWSEEFSLDGFVALVEAAARWLGRRPPRIVERYPFLVGKTAADLPGLDECRRCLSAEGAWLVATADPIHHGAGYGTPEGERRPLESPETAGWARAAVQEGFDRLAARDFAAFLRQAEAVKSDFRDPGPVVAELLLGDLRAVVHDLRLVGYSDVLGAPEPTWVAGALATIAPVPVDAGQPS